MNEDQAKELLKKSALKTTANFTDRLMEQLEAKPAAQVQPNFPSITGTFVLLAGVLLLVSFILFYTDFKFLAEIKVMGNAYHTKFFVIFLFLVLLGANHLLKLQHRSKSLFNN